MVSISTSIELYDRVSAPIYKMLGALDNLTSAFESVETSMDGGFDTTQIEAARKVTESVALDVVKLGQNIEDNEEHQRKFNQSVQNGASSMDGLVGKVIGLVSAYAGMQTIKKAMDISDELTQTTARIDMMNDGLQSTPELMNMIYNSAQNARGSFMDMAAVVAKFGNNAGDAFGSSEEVVAFANLIQKQMTIAGASTAEASNAMLQLSQALGSGTLRGDELNSIFEQAPNLIQSIADYLNVPIGQIRAMAQEGQLSADIVKNAIFAASDDINAKFEQMPMTWGQVWTTMKNAALMKFQPVLDKINKLANNQDFQRFMSGMIEGFATISMYLLEIMDFAGMIATFFADNWSVIEPIVMGIATALGLYTAALLINNAVQGISAIVSSTKAAADMMAAGATFTAASAQWGYNAALLACPVTWIVLLIIALIAAVIALCSYFAKLSNSADTTFGVMAGGVYWVVQLFKNLGLCIANFAVAVAKVVGALGTNIAAAFHNAITSVQAWWYDLMSTALGVIESICAALNKLPFVSFDYSGITAKANEYAAKSAAAAGNKKEYASLADAWSEGLNTFEVFESGWGKEAFATGAAWGDKVSNKVSNTLSDAVGNAFDTVFDLGGGGGGIGSNVADIADSTGSMADSMDITNEELKYLREIAERDTINRFTTAEIKVEMTNNNNVSSDMDLDGIVDYLTNGVNEAMEKAAEGVHV